MAVTLSERLPATSRTSSPSAARASASASACEDLGLFGHGLQARVRRQTEAEDLVFESHGVKVVIDPKSLPTRRHRARLRAEGLNEGFKFNNPNVKASAAAARASTSEPRAMSIDLTQDYFALFALPRAMPSTMGALEAAWHELQGRCIPTATPICPTEKRRSMQWATRVNEGFRVLRKPLARAQYLLELAGVDAGARDQHRDVAPSS
jgi:Fe-S cluster assembly iron-binding protein IscA